MNIHNIINTIEKNVEIYEMLQYCPYKILKQWEYSKHPKGTTIYRQGEEFDYFYIMINGVANIYIMSESGKKYSQAIYTKGDYLGELEIFDKKPSVCYVEALTDVELIGLKREFFLQWLEHDRNITYYINRSLSRQFYELSKKAGMDTLYSLKYRFCNYLLHSLPKGIPTEGGIKIKVDKNQISEHLAVTPRSINRVLKEFNSKHILEINSQYIIIKDIEALKQEEEQSMYE